MIELSACARHALPLFSTGADGGFHSGLGEPGDTSSTRQTAICDDLRQLAAGPDAGTYAALAWVSAAPLLGVTRWAVRRTDVGYDDPRNRDVRPYLCWRAV